MCHYQRLKSFVEMAVDDLKVHNPSEYWIVNQERNRREMEQYLSKHELEFLRGVHDLYS
jgi:hypothetical protein